MELVRVTVVVPRVVVVVGVMTGPTKIDISALFESFFPIALRTRTIAICESCLVSYLIDRPNRSLIQKLRQM